MKLRNKVFLFVLSAVIIPLSVLGFYAYMQSKTYAQKQAKQYQLHELSQRGMAIQNAFNNHLSALSLLAESEIVDQYVKISRPEERYSLALNPLLRAFANVSKAYNDFYEIRLVKQSGEEDARFSPIFLPNLTDKENNRYWFKHMQSIEGDQALIFDTNQDNNTLALYAIQKIYRTLPSGITLKNKVWGYLVITISPNLLSQVMAESEENAGVSFIIESSQRAFYSDNAMLSTKTLPHYLSTRLIEAAQQQSLFTLNYNNQDMAFGATQLSTGHYLVVGVSLAKLYENTLQLALVSAGITLFMILLVALVTYRTLSNSLLAPIEKLIRASQKISQGKLGVRIRHKRADEIGLVFNSFNEMSNSLNQSRKTLDEYQSHLEEMVSSRTIALQNTNDELKKSRQEAEQANELKSRFLANMSHEIRTPLTAILGFTEHALGKGIQDPEIQLLLQRVAKNSHHLLALINDILDLAKIESGKLELEEIEISLFDLLSDIETYCLNKTHDKNISFAINYHFPVPERFTTDPTRLRQILLNICSNAIKFTKQGQVTIDIHYDSATNDLLIKIRDTGIGMSGEEISRLFNPFVQADLSTTRNYGGTGLGLAITKHLADMLGCKLEVSSVKHQGTQFCIRLNNLINVGQLVDEKPFNEKAQDNSNDIDFNASNKRVLLAEDNPDNQTLVRLLFEPLAVDLQVVENGLLAVEHAIADDFDLILMDMQMPLMGGMEAIGMLKQTGIDTPIIALTANCMASEIEEYTQIGCVETLAKPIDNHLFYKLMKKYLVTQNGLNKLDDKSNAYQNTEQYRQLVASFKLNLPNTVKLMIAAAQQNTLDKVKAEAHKLKGIASSMGYPDITLLAADIEKYAKANDTDNINKRLDKLASLVENME
ncbi:hypothetical protein C2869_00410 [Saccharobesus litoralis]|uniref:histidine kinase n=1 Tax=Saccharobesus litoralis TaxID=2172099 RepID=A0A2S0VLA6_9ALTE|nr:hybrid sensor histidine kinase/response regulator [Saccharobesus litoralis]AWB64993.1 hypothetical protein C2869_00410 [Saccharobesus litoralis]